VGVNKVVKFTFSKYIILGPNPLIDFKTATGTAIKFTSSVVNKCFITKPTNLLTPITTYNVVLHSNCVTDLSGAGLAAPYTVKFKTA